MTLACSWCDQNVTAIVSNRRSLAIQECLLADLMPTAPRAGGFRLTHGGFIAKTRPFSHEKESEGDKERAQ